MGDKAKTLLNVRSSIGEFSIAGTLFAINNIAIEKNDAKIPVTTTWLAVFFPYISEIKSVDRKVRGYGKIPTESSKRWLPKIFKSKGYQ